MPKLVIMIGLPASGKSTYAENFAKENEYELIAHDKLPFMFNDKFNRICELAIQNIDNNKNTIVDDLFVEKYKRVALSELAKEHGAEVEYIVMDTPLDKCLELNMKRNRRVPQGVIYIANDMYEKPTKEECSKITVVTREE